jgi:hypothetical protein
MPGLMLSDTRPHGNVRPIGIASGSHADGDFLWLDEHPGKSSVRLPLGSFFGPEPSHNASQRQILTIQGPSGAGKSSLALL